MAQLVTAYKRLTNKYVGTYRHLDKWDYDNPIRLKVLGGMFLSAYDLAAREGQPDRNIDPSEGGESYHRVVLMNPRGISDEDVEQAIYSEFSSHGCAHEHDCCGCMSTGVDLVKKGRREWLMKLRYSYNY